MKYNDLTIQKLRELSILEVADKLGFKLKGLGDEGRRALCPYHDDKHPSLHFSKKNGIFKCFVCGAKGDLFKLVMDDRNCTFLEACDWLINEFHIVVIEETTHLTNLTNNLSAFSAISAGQKNSSDSCNSLLESVALQSCSVKSSVVPLPSDLVSRSLSLDSLFCQSVVSAGYLSEAQLRHAANRYRLGATKDGGVIFWEIDDQQQVHTGKIMYYQSDCHRDKSHSPTWVHSLMKDNLPTNYELQHCLFGLHLLCPAEIAEIAERSPSEIAKRSQISVISAISAGPQKVAIVESEKTAVIFSEVFKDFVWLSCGGLQMFKPELLAPLVNHKVIIFPDTDLTGGTYRCWADIALQASKLYQFRYPLRISNLLELHATVSQKQRKIDIVDFLFEHISYESNVQK